MVGIRRRRTPNAPNVAGRGANFTGTLDGGGGDGDGSGTSVAWALGDAMAPLHAEGRAGAGTVYDAVVELAAPPEGSPAKPAARTRADATADEGTSEGDARGDGSLAQIRADQHRAVSASAGVPSDPEGIAAPGRRTETRVRGWGGVAGIRQLRRGAARGSEGREREPVRRGGVSVMEEGVTLRERCV